jgi:hypothetical protein
MSSNKSAADIRYVIEHAKFNNPGSVKSTCNTVYKWLHQNKDGYRDFFRECYNALLSALFGLSLPQSMLSCVAARPSELETLLDFLRPTGTFWQAMLEVDAESLNHYCLPASQLPVHTQALLCTGTGVPLPLRHGATDASLLFHTQQLSLLAHQKRHIAQLCFLNNARARTGFISCMQAYKTCNPGLTMLLP